MRISAHGMLYGIICPIVFTRQNCVAIRLNYKDTPIRMKQRLLSLSRIHIFYPQSLRKPIYLLLCMVGSVERAEVGLCNGWKWKQSKMLAYVHLYIFMNMSKMYNNLHTGFPYFKKQTRKGREHKSIINYVKLCCKQVSMNAWEDADVVVKPSSQPVFTHLHMYIYTRTKKLQQEQKENSILRWMHVIQANLLFEKLRNAIVIDPLYFEGHRNLFEYYYKFCLVKQNMFERFNETTKTTVYYCSMCTHLWTYMHRLYKFICTYQVGRIVKLPQLVIPVLRKYI